MLTGDLTACSSELENSYGIGLAAGSEDAKVRACVPECITYASFLPSACIVCLTRAPVLVPDPPCRLSHVRRRCGGDLGRWVPVWRLRRG